MDEFLSVELAKKELEKRIKKAEKERQELETAIGSNKSNVPNKLLKAFNKKEIEIVALKDALNKIEGLERRSYVGALKDKKYADAVEKLKEYREILEDIYEEHYEEPEHSEEIEDAEKERLESSSPEGEMSEEEQFDTEIANFDSNKIDNLIARARFELLKKKVAKLKEKQGKIEAKQTKKINRKLSRHIKRNCKMLNNDLLEKNKNSYFEKYQVKAQIAYNKVNFISEDQGLVEKAKNIVSYVNFIPTFMNIGIGTILEYYCKGLQKKNNIVIGARKLPSKLVEKIKSRVEKAKEKKARK